MEVIFSYVSKFYSTFQGCPASNPVIFTREPLSPWGGGKRICNLIVNRIGSELVQEIDSLIVMDLLSN